MHMIRNRTFTALLSVSALGLIACATAQEEDDGIANPDDRDDAVAELVRLTGAPVSLEIGETGVSRVLAMTYALPSRSADPALAARDFLTSHHNAFRLAADAATDFDVTSVDTDRAGGLHHVTLQRTYEGIPVFQGAITVHMNPANGVFRALGDEFYQVDRPTNRKMMEPADAVAAAGRALGVNGLAPAFESSEGLRTTFIASRALDPIPVELRIFQVAPGANRYAYQVVLAWLDDNREQQMQLALVDAADGSLLHNSSLVTTFAGNVFRSNPLGARTVVSFNGDPTASPNGWVDATRRTQGNNAVAATDLDRNNAIGANEIQPTPNAANDTYDFPFSTAQNASLFREAAVVNAFYFVNDYHDRTYALGFTEASRNFQLNNFGRGGAQNDPVNVDAQDGAGTNNANFGTPPDGSRPRMQMFLFTFNGGAQEDGDFDGGVIYHENSHGISNRLVGGGSTACLGGIQSGSMGEGWGDFIGASFLNDPVVGAYVTGNLTVGIRRASMANSPFTYANIKDGTMTEVHDGGEIWAATLFDVRKALGAAVTEQLVVSGMKLTPCNPTMLQARDGIIQADQQINAGANRCALFTAFAGRQMGTGASSANHNTTTGVVLSTAVPADCGGGGGGNVVFTDDFETDKGWALAGTNTATTGRWQRANPEATTSGGVTTQQGTTTSGSFDLVTAGAAGAAAGTNDVDAGVTTIQSPAIAIPAGGTVTLALSSYFAHLNNSTADDFFRVQIVGNTTVTVINTLGAATNVAATFARTSINISQFAGQTVRIVVSVADNGTASLIEAGVDDVTITRQ
jgi:extracellular elastinolytic metalloproteinase